MKKLITLVLFTLMLTGCSHLQLDTPWGILTTESVKKVYKEQKEVYKQWDAEKHMKYNTK